MSLSSPRSSPVLLAANLAVVWPVTLAAIGAVVGVPAAAVVPFFSETGEWQDIPALLPSSIFYAAATGALYGIVIAVAAGVLALRHSAGAYVHAVRSTLVTVAAFLFLGGAVAFNDTLREQQEFIGLYGLPVALGTWLGWRAVPAIVRSYRHRM